jgi:hypothetical protein
VEATTIAQNFVLLLVENVVWNFTFLPYFPYHFTIFVCVFQIFSLFNLLFVPYFPYHFTFYPYFLKLNYAGNIIEWVVWVSEQEMKSNSEKLKWPTYLYIYIFMRIINFIQFLLVIFLSWWVSNFHNQIYFT